MSEEPTNPSKRARPLGWIFGLLAVAALAAAVLHFSDLRMFLQLHGHEAWMSTNKPPT